MRCGRCSAADKGMRDDSTRTEIYLTLVSFSPWYCTILCSVEEVVGPWPAHRRRPCQVISHLSHEHLGSRHYHGWCNGKCCCFVFNGISVFVLRKKKLEMSGKKERKMATNASTEGPCLVFIQIKGRPDTESYQAPSPDPTTLCDRKDYLLIESIMGLMPRPGNFRPVFRLYSLMRGCRA